MRYIPGGFLHLFRLISNKDRLCGVVKQRSVTVSFKIMSKKKAPKKIKEKEKKQPPEQEAEKDHAFDFGGLPDRNLKKNLGC